MGGGNVYMCANMINDTLEKKKIIIYKIKVFGYFVKKWAIFLLSNICCCCKTYAVTQYFKRIGGGYFPVTVYITKFDLFGG